MQKSQHLLKNLIKQEQKSKKSLDISSSYHFEFPCASYLKSVSSLEQSEKTEDLISEAEVSEFYTEGKKSNRRKNKANKSAKNKNSVKGPSAKVKKQEAKIEKLEYLLKHEETSEQDIWHKIQAKIDHQAPITEQKNLKKDKSNKRNTKSKKTKTQTKEQPIPKTELKEQVQAKDEPNIKEYHMQHIDYLTSICEFQIVDFQYHHRKQNFKVEKDVLFVLVQKKVKDQSKIQDVPSELRLTGEKICESKQLFGELLRFYRGLSQDVGLTRE